MEDHYFTLGIERKANNDKIKQAYRDCCKKYHPDTGGGDGNSFKNVQKAYEVLSDKGKRAAYDRELTENNRTAPPFSADSTDHTATGPFRRERSHFSNLADRLYHDLFSHSFFGVGENIGLELILTEREAWKGGVFRISIPLRGGHRRTIHLHIQGPLTRERRLQFSLEEIGLPASMLTIDVCIE